MPVTFDLIRAEKAEQPINRYVAMVAGADFDRSSSALPAKLLSLESRGVGIGCGTIPTNHFHFGMLGEPRRQAFGSAIGQQVNGRPFLQIALNLAVSAAFPKRKIIHSQNANGSSLGRGPGSTCRRRVSALVGIENWPATRELGSPPSKASHLLGPGQRVWSPSPKFYHRRQSFTEDRSGAVLIATAKTSHRQLDLNDLLMGGERL